MQFSEVYKFQGKQTSKHHFKTVLKTYIPNRSAEGKVQRMRHFSQKLAKFRSLNIVDCWNIANPLVLYSVKF